MFRRLKDLRRVATRDDRRGLPRPRLHRRAVGSRGGRAASIAAETPKFSPAPPGRQFCATLGQSEADFGKLERYNSSGENVVCAFGVLIRERGFLCSKQPPALSGRRTTA